MARECCVYVIGPNPTLVKVGMTSNVTRRLGNLQVGHPDELRIFYEVPVHEDMAHEVERGAHEALRKHRRYGEWFNVSPDAALEAIQSALAKRLEYGTVTEFRRPSPYDGIRRVGKDWWSVKLRFGRLNMDLGRFRSEADAIRAHEETMAKLLEKAA